MLYKFLHHHQLFHVNLFISYIIKVYITVLNKLRLIYDL